MQVDLTADFERNRDNNVMHANKVIVRVTGPNAAECAAAAAAAILKFEAECNKAEPGAAK